MKKTVLFLAAVAMFAVVPVVASAGQYPAKQVTVVCPVAPGGQSDMTSRIFAGEMEKLLGKPFIVVNRPGASNSIGMEYVKNRRPDGYTIGFMPVEVCMIRALGLTDLNSADFTFFVRAMTTPATLTVHANSPWKTMDEFIADAKANPGKIKMGNAGTGSIWHIAAAALEEKTGVKFTHVPFDGAALAATALMGGNIDAITVSPPEIKAAVDGGEFRALAVLGDTPSPVLPGIKTAKEQGYDVSVESFGTFAVPLNTPKEILDILEEAAKKAVNSEEAKKFFADRGFTHSYLNAADTQKFIAEQQALYDELIPKLGLAVNKK